MKRLYPAILILLPLLVFGQVLGNDFLALDDELLILDNVKVHAMTFANLKAIFTTYDPELYIPVTLFTYMIEYSIFGANPVVFHATNLILHLANALLVFVILRKLLDERAAFLCALLFSVHPLQVEAVAWASGRKDLLAGFFFLLSLYSYLGYRETGERYWLGFVFFVLGLGSKISVFPLPFVLIALDWMQNGSVTKKDWKEKIPFFLASAIFLGIAFYGKAAQLVSPWVPITLSFAAVPLYLQHFFLPLGLSIFYPFVDEVSVMHPRILTGVFVILGLASAFFYGLRHNKRLMFGLLFFGLLLLPSLLNVVKGGEDGLYDFYLGSDRYMYLPMIGILFLVFLYFPKKLKIAVVPLVLVCSVLSFRYGTNWATSERLFAHAIAQESNSHIAYNNLAGMYAAGGRFDEAIPLYEQSIAIQKNSRALFNLAQIYQHQRDYERAIARYEELLAFQPLHTAGHARAGDLYLERGNTQMALLHTQAALDQDQGSALAHFTMGRLYEIAGKMDYAGLEYRAALALEPKNERFLQKKP